MMRLLDKYQHALATMPPPGGNGCHTSLLGIANYGVMIGLDDGRIHGDIRGAIPAGTRRVSDREIRDAVSKARTEQRPRDSEIARGASCIHDRAGISPAFNGHWALRALVRAGGGSVEEMAVLDNPGGDHVRIDWLPHEDTFHLLEALYEPDDHLFIGGIHDGRANVRPVRDWVHLFRRHASWGPAAARALGRRFPGIIPNPLSGEAGLTKTGRVTYRGDACVAKFKFAVVEFDDLSKPEQLAFWRGIELPVVALIDSGGKSIHAWVRVDCKTAEEWTREVEDRLFKTVLEPLGVDGACRNESRISRLPGVRREGRGTWQKLLYLNPRGGSI